MRFQVEFAPRQGRFLSFQPSRSFVEIVDIQRSRPVRIDGPRPSGATRWGSGSGPRVKAPEPFHLPNPSILGAGSSHTQIGGNGHAGHIVRRPPALTKFRRHRGALPLLRKQKGPLPPGVSEDSAPPDLKDGTLGRGSPSLDPARRRRPPRQPGDDTGRPLPSSLGRRPFPFHPWSAPQREGIKKPARGPPPQSPPPPPISLDRRRRGRASWARALPPGACASLPGIRARSPSETLARSGRRRRGSTPAGPIPRRGSPGGKSR